VASFAGLGRVVSVGQRNSALLLIDGEGER
jgi:hypothetical protein